MPDARVRKLRRRAIGASRESFLIRLHRHSILSWHDGRNHRSRRPDRRCASCSPRPARGSTQLRPRPRGHARGHAIAGHPVIPRFTSRLKWGDRLRRRGADTAARELRQLGACLAALGRQSLFGKTQTAMGTGTPGPAGTVLSRIVLPSSRSAIRYSATVESSSGLLRRAHSPVVVSTGAATVSGVRKPPGDRA